MLQMEVDCGRGLQPHGLSDLPDRGWISLLLDTGHQVIVDLLLHFGKLFHGRPPHGVVSHNCLFRKLQ